jgi:hypothetical protein
VAVESEAPVRLRAAGRLSRNGKQFTADGETNVRAGTEYKVTTERPSVNINVKELDAGSWVMFELPGFTTASTGTEQSSLDALRKASTTSYYKGNGSLWVKVVSTGDVLGSGLVRARCRRQPAGQSLGRILLFEQEPPGCARGLFCEEQHG